MASSVGGYQLPCLVQEIPYPALIILVLLMLCCFYFELRKSKFCKFSKAKSLNLALISIMRYIELQLKAKLKVAIMIPPTVAHSSLGLLAVDCAAPTEAWGGVGLLVTRGGLEREIIFLSNRSRQEAKAWPGLPALASPTLMAPVHQSSQRKTLPCSRHSTVHR